MFFFVTQFTIFLIILVLMIVAVTIYENYISNKKSKNCRSDSHGKPPSPIALPIIGHLHLLAGYQVPYQAFTDLARKFGDVVGLRLGYVKCVVVNGKMNIREALVTKGHHFDSRPDFQRYQELFQGNKENSLAFCNWSDTQKTRRDMLKAYTFPRAFTNKFYTLESLISEGTNMILSQISNRVSSGPMTVKPLVLKACANIFTTHFCSKHFEFEDPDFSMMVDNYDDIFYEVNQGYAADFLPFLMPFHNRNLRRVNCLTREIRDFVLDRLIEDRFDRYNLDFEPEDYVDSLIKCVRQGDVPELTWDSALFALEDIIGGHSAVGNFLVKLLAFLAKEPQVQTRIQEEIDHVVGHAKQVTISDRPRLPYTEATIFEAIRLIASPIVPRVANQDSSINGYKIDKGTLIFLNNYDLSMSEKLWDNPEKFQPERFIRDDRLVKPEHFLPFGGGRRSCMGYKMVQLVTFGLMGGLLQKYTVLPAHAGNNGKIEVPVGSLALPKDTFKFRFAERQRHGITAQISSQDKVWIIQWSSLRVFFEWNHCVEDGSCGIAGASQEPANFQTCQIV